VGGSRSRAMGKITDILPGTHLCLLYRSEEERQAVLTEYIRRGLEAGERVLYIADTPGGLEIREFLQKAGIDVREAERRDQLRFITAEEAYLREGRFDPKAMLDLLREDTKEALDQGFTGLRATGEMTWALRGFPGSERLIEYEALLNDFFPGSACIGLCQYDVRRFPPEILLDVLRTHPVAAIGTHLHENPFYIPPEEFLRGVADEVTLGRWLGTLEDRRKILTSLQGYADALAERVKELSCVGGLRELVMREDLGLPEIFEAALPIIRSGWRWPDRVQVRIEFEGKVYATPGFTESPWRKVAPLKRKGMEVGKIEVAYPDPPPEPDPFLPEETELLANIAHTLSRLIETRHAHGQIRYLNSLLWAIRNVNQLIARERDRDRLLQGICETLVSTRGYLKAWIALWDESGALLTAKEAGLGEHFLPLLEGLRQGKKPLCVRMALEKSDPILIENPLSACAECPLAQWYGSRKVMAMRLENAGKVYGVLVVSVPGEVDVGEMERNLLKEVAGDIALGLKALELEEEAKRAEEAHRTLVQNSLQGLAIIQDGRVVFANPALAEISGYTVEELLALSPEEIEAVVHPEDRERVLKTMRERLAGKEVPARRNSAFCAKTVPCVGWRPWPLAWNTGAGRPSRSLTWTSRSGSGRKKGRLSSSNASPCSIGQARRSSKRYRIPSGCMRRCIGLWLSSCPRRPSSWHSKSPRRKRRRFTFSIKAAVTLPEKFPKGKD